MTKLKDKIKHALDECLILVTGAQILVGFGYNGAFQPGFDKLPESSQYLKIGSLALLLVSLALFLTPVAYHRIVENEQSNEHFHRFIKRVVMLALLPFALGMGIDIYVVMAKTADPLVAWAFGGGIVLVALYFWYGLQFATKNRKRKQKMEDTPKEKSPEQNQAKKEDDGTAKLPDKIDQVLIEARVVLPGAQALLGFQFALFLMQDFEKLPTALKFVHFASLVFIALTTILLLAPAAYHRIVENGEDTEEMHRFSSWMVVSAMIPLALGVSSEFLVVFYKVTQDTGLSIACGVIVLLFFMGVWFGFTLLRRLALAKSPSRPSAPATTPT